MGRITNKFKITNKLKIYLHIWIWYTSRMVYRETVVVLAGQLSILLSLKSQSFMATQISATLESVAGWPQFLSQNSEQAPTFLNTSGCYFYSSGNGGQANECPCNEGRMASCSKNFFIPAVLTYIWEPTEDWIVYKQKNMYRVVWIVCSKTWYLKVNIAQFGGYKHDSEFRFVHILLQHTNM